MQIGGPGILASEVGKAAIGWQNWNSEATANEKLLFSNQCRYEMWIYPALAPVLGLWPLAELQLLRPRNGPLRSSAPSCQFYEARGIGQEGGTDEIC